MRLELKLISILLIKFYIYINDKIIYICVCVYIICSFICYILAD